MAVYSGTLLGITWNCGEVNVELREAAEWLATYLKAGERDQRAIHDAAEAAGIDRDTLWDAKRRIGVRTRRVFDWRWKQHGNGKPGDRCGTVIPLARVLI